MSNTNTAKYPYPKQHASKPRGIPFGSGSGTSAIRRRYVRFRTKVV